MRINIAGGTGLMGRIHKPLFEKQGHEVIISGRNTTPCLEEAAIISDLTIVSVPISATEETIKRVAPCSRALMDFTSLKSFPIDTMLKYSTENCEVGGLHPLYGEVKSLEGRTVVYCETERSSWRCREVVDTLHNSGLKIKKMTAEDHDLVVQGVLQNGRTILLESFASLLEETGFNARELYEISPPPTKLLIDLVARQVDSKNDELYQIMRDYNPSTTRIANHLSESFKKVSVNYSPEKIRNFFGEEFLQEAQERAKKVIG